MKNGKLRKTQKAGGLETSPLPLQFPPAPILIDIDLIIPKVYTKQIESGIQQMANLSSLYYRATWWLFAERWERVNLPCCRPFSVT